MIKENELDELLELDLYNKSYKLVSKLFDKKVDKRGKPYIEHLEFVSSSFNEIDYKVVGLLHDILEDTFFTYSDLIKLGYPNYIADTVSILTRRDNESYNDFIDRIIKSNNLLAIRVKERDMFHNMSEERLKYLDEIEANRLRNKYKNEYIKLTNYLKGRGL